MGAFGTRSQEHNVRLSRFVCDYKHLFCTKVVLRAEKLCLATYLEDEYNELWHPVKGRNLHEILKDMHFDPLDGPAFNIIA